MTRLYYYRGGSSKSNLWSEDYLWTRLIQSYRFHLCDHVPWSCQRQNFLDDQRWSNGLTDNCNLAPWHLECTYFQLFFVGKSPSPGEWRWVNWVSRVEGISLSKNHSVSPAGKWKPWELNYVHIAPKKLVCIQVTYFVQFSFVSASECKAIWIRIWIRCVREEFRAFCILHMWLSIQWCFKIFNVHSTKNFSMPVSAYAHVINTLRRCTGFLESAKPPYLLVRRWAQGIFFFASLLKRVVLADNNLPLPDLPKSMSFLTSDFLW